MNTAAAAIWEYKNDFFSIVIREHEEKPGSFIFCSGVSIPMFNPLCWRKTGICSNPAFKGLQLMRANVSHYAISRGMKTQRADAECPHEIGRGDGWYQESPLLIEGASYEDVQDILNFSARDLIQSVLNACQIDAGIPEGEMAPEKMQRFLESLVKPA